MSTFEKAVDLHRAFVEFHERRQAAVMPIPRGGAACGRPARRVVTIRSGVPNLEIVLSTKPDGTVANAITYGQFSGAVVDFVIIAFMVFMITRSDRGGGGR